MPACTKAPRLAPRGLDFTLASDPGGDCRKAPQQIVGHVVDLGRSAAAFAHLGLGTAPSTDGVEQRLDAEAHLALAQLDRGVERLLPRLLGAVPLAQGSGTQRKLERGVGDG